TAPVQEGGQGEDAPAGEGGQAPGVPELTPRDRDEADAEVTLPGKDGQTVYTLGPALATGRIVSTARAEVQTGQWLVALEMRKGEDGIDKLKESAAQYYHQDPVRPEADAADALDSAAQ